METKPGPAVEAGFGKRRPAFRGRPIPQLGYEGRGRGVEKRAENHLIFTLRTFSIVPGES